MAHFMVEQEYTMDSSLLEIIVCPNCQGRLKLNHDKTELICRFDHIAYPIKDGVPILLIESSRKLQEGDK